MLRSVTEGVMEARKVGGKSDNVKATFRLIRMQIQKLKLVILIAQPLYLATSLRDTSSGPAQPFGWRNITILGRLR